MVIGTLPELTSLYSQSYTTDKRHAVNWTKVQLMSSCLQVYLVMVQQLDNTLHGLGLLTWSDSLIPFNYTTCTIRVTNTIINMKLVSGGHASHYKLLIKREDPVSKLFLFMFCLLLNCNVIYLNTIVGTLA